MGHPAIGYLGAVAALCAALCAVLPRPGMFFGMALGIGAVALGVQAYRATGQPPRLRLAGVAIAVVGALALVVSLGRYALTLAVVSELESMF